MKGTVDARATGRFVRLPATISVGAARAAFPEGGWAVITGEEETGIGLASLGDLEVHDETTPLAVVARALPPLVVVAAEVHPVVAVQSPAFQTVGLGQPVLVERDGVAAGVWAGEDLADTLFAYRGDPRSGLVSDSSIAKIRRLCGFQQAGQSCTAIETFPERPDDPPECANPSGLATHRFVL